MNKKTKYLILGMLGLIFIGLSSLKFSIIEDSFNEAVAEVVWDKTADKFTEVPIPINEIDELRESKDSSSRNVLIGLWGVAVTFMGFLFIA